AMDALRLLTSTAILFDEFEPILHLRPEHPRTITEMLTGNMLPKLDALYKAAGANSIGYILSTNYVERLDSAAISVGRFDRMHFIYYADAASRVCRLVSELTLLINRMKSAGINETLKPGVYRRVTEVAAKNARRYINHLCRKGWFVSPSEIKTTPVPDSLIGIDENPTRFISPHTANELNPVWDYIIKGEPSDDETSKNAKVNEITWDLFGSAERMLEGANLSAKSVETADRTIMRMV